jgi:uncharacterized membrane protein YoaK (UPF0700 family)
VQLAALLAALAGLVDAIGFLAFGGVFLASPDANDTVLGTNLAKGNGLALLAGALLIAFVGGVVLVTLLTVNVRRLRRTLVLIVATLMLLAAFCASVFDVAYAPAVLLAMAIGSAHCVFERDNPELQEAMSPSAQIVRFGEALTRGRAGANPRQIGLHASFWLAFVIGGLGGASAWLSLDIRALALAGVFAAGLTVRTWLIERHLLPG